MPKWVDRTGKKYGMLTCVEYLGDRRWRCICDCGNECIRANAGHLNENSSCGCNKPELNKKAGLKRAVHGDSRTKLYKRWTSMIQRCENPNNDFYQNYGGRGISVCDEWHDYAAFKEWSISNGYDEKLSIDRIDVDGNYEPGNCRWTTFSVQMSNRRPYHRKELWKPVEALDANGNAVKKFKRIDDAIKWLGKSDGTGISKALHGVQETAYGYKWRFVNG
jgi:hypothetical protein